MKGLNAALLLHLSLHSLATVAQAETPTFTLRNTDEYIGDLTNDQGTGPSDIKVIDNNDGLEVIVGADRTQEILGVAREHCQNPGSEDCTTQMNAALGVGPSSNGLQTRVVPWAPAGVVAAIAGIFQWVMNRIDKDFTTNLKVVHVKLSKEEKEQAASWEQTDSIQVKPQEGDPVTISLDNTQPQLSNVPTLTLDDNGDITIDFKGTEAAIQNAWSGVMCKREEGITLQCIIDRTRVLLRLIQLAGDANQLMWLSISVTLKPKHELLIEAIKDSEDYAENLWFDKSIAKEAKRKIGAVMAWTTFADTMAAIPIQNGLMKWSKSWIETQEDLIRYECPEGDKRTYCGNCGGDASEPKDGIIDGVLSLSRTIMGKCIGLGDGEAKGLQGCECFKDPGYEPYQLSIQDSEDFYNYVMTGNNGNNGNNGGDDPEKFEKTCFKEQPEIRNDPSRWAWANVTHLVEKIEEFCSKDFVKGDDNTQEDYHSADWELDDGRKKEDKLRGDFRLSVTHKGIDPPEKNFCINKLRDEIVYGCDHHERLNQFDYKWGGRLKIESTGMEFEVYPMTPRLGLAEGNNFECKSFATRTDKDNKGRNKDELPDEIDNQMMKQMCVHYLFEDWRGDDNKLDCGGYYNIVMEHSRNYDSQRDCWRYNYGCISDLIQKENSVVMRATHFTVSDGKTPNYWSIHCWIGFDDY